MTYALTVRRQDLIQAVARFDTLAEATAAMDIRRREEAGPEPYVLQVRELLPYQAVIDGKIVADSVVVPSRFPLLDRTAARALADAIVAAVQTVSASVVDLGSGAVIEFRWGEIAPWLLYTLYGREHLLAEAVRRRGWTDDRGGVCDRLFRRVTWTGDVDPLVRDLKRRMNAILNEWE